MAGAAARAVAMPTAPEVETIQMPVVAMPTDQSAIGNLQSAIPQDSSEVTIRPARREDLDAICRLEAGCFSAYNLSRRVALTGGVRYRVDQNRVSAVTDQRRDSQAVYVGTAFKF